MLDQLLRETAQRLGSAERARALVRRVLGMIADEEYGALPGFLHAFQEEGLEAEAASWVGVGAAEPLDAGQVETGLGPAVVADLAAELDLDREPLAVALGLVIPRCVDLVTAQGTVPPHPVVADRVAGLLEELARADAATATPGSGRAGARPLREGGGADPAGGGPVAQGAGAAVGRDREAGVADRERAPVPRTASGSGADRAPGAGSRGRAAVAAPESRLRRGGGRLLLWAGALLALGLLLWWLPGRPDRAAGVDARPQTSTAPAAADGRRTPAPRDDVRPTPPRGPTAAAGLPPGRAPVEPSEPAAPAAAPAPGAFDPAAAVRRAYRAALDALRALEESPRAQEVVEALNLSIVDFAPGSAAIPTAGEALLAEAAQALRTLPSTTRIEIGGHTDSTGEPALNRALSEARARAVRNTLVAHGAPAAMLTVRGYGSEHPIADDDTPEGRFRNRRITYRLLP